MANFRIDPKARIGNVQLQAADLERQKDFYQDVLGFREIDRQGDSLSFSASGEPPAQIILKHLQGARPRSFSSPGLFHVAFLLPDRTELARTLRRVSEQEWKFQGFADHGVSEALYLSDPEGNGIELYRDRPRGEWPLRGNKIAMVTKGLDVQDLLRELEGKEPGEAGLHPATTIGHVHLQVSDLQKAGEFYHKVLGFNITQDDYPGALFVSAGGYHHHIGMNIWNSRGGSPSPRDAVGLLSFGIVVSGPESIQSLKRRLEEAGLGVVEGTRPEEPLPSLRLQDPDGIRIDISLQDRVNVVAS